MNITKDKLVEAQEIIAKGKDKCFSDSDWNWALKVLVEAFRNGYSVVKTT